MNDDLDGRLRWVLALALGSIGGEVALLPLKGYSHKEIAALTGRSERTDGNRETVGAA